MLYIYDYTDEQNTSRIPFYISETLDPTAMVKYNFDKPLFCVLADEEQLPQLFIERTNNISETSKQQFAKLPLTHSDIWMPASIALGYSLVAKKIYEKSTHIKTSLSFAPALAMYIGVATAYKLSAHQGAYDTHQMTIGGAVGSAAAYCLAKLVKQDGFKLGRFIGAVSLGAVCFHISELTLGLHRLAIENALKEEKQHAIDHELSLRSQQLIRYSERVTNLKNQLVDVNSSIHVIKEQLSQKYGGAYENVDGDLLDRANLLLLKREKIEEHLEHLKHAIFVVEKESEYIRNEAHN